MKTVYLAGPVIGCNEEQAKGWRDAFAARLADVGLRGVSPLRCEPPKTTAVYTSTYDDLRFGTARAIAAKNEFDVRNCDFALFYVPREAVERNPVYGTVCELAWAHILNKPSVLVTDDRYIAGHPLITQCARWVLPNLDDAFDVIVGLLKDYQ